MTLNNFVHSNYLLIVRVGSGRAKRSTDWLHKDQLFNYTEANLRNLTYYVAAMLSADISPSTKVIIGDGNIIGGYENRKLAEGATYSIVQIATVQLEVGMLCCLYVLLGRALGHLYRLNCL